MGTKLVLQVITDVICLTIVWLPTLLLSIIGQPFRRGFHCDDTSIRYPYKDSIVSSLVLGCFSLGVPIVSIIIVEIFCWRYNSPSNSRSKGSSSHYSASSSIKKQPRPVLTLIGKILHLVAIFLFGAACSELVTDSGKYTIGRLRPHFYDVCKPESLDGTLLCPLNEPSKYIINYICTGTDTHRIKNARLSFPSGHASFSAYGMIFLVFYLQCRMNWSGSKLLRPTVQISALMLSWYTGLSRISDYKHHWDDVLVGFLIGITVASLTALYVSTLFKQRSARYETFLMSQTKIDMELNSDSYTSGSK